MKTFLKIIIFPIALGVIAYALNMIFGATTIPYITSRNINGIIIQTYDIYGYMENLRQSFTGTTALSLSLPTRQWMNTPITNTQFWEATTNNLALILDWGIFAINILLYPFRILAYGLRCVLAVAGLPMVNTPYDYTLKWLVDLVNGFITIPQIAYI